MSLNPQEYKFFYAAGIVLYSFKCAESGFSGMQKLHPQFHHKPISVNSLIFIHTEIFRPFFSDSEIEYYIIKCILNFLFD